MPWYKNMKNSPLPVETDDGNAISVRGKAPFYVSRRTEGSKQFLRYKTKGKVRFIRDDPKDNIRQKPVIQEAKANLLVPAPSAPVSDIPGNDSTVDDKSASDAPTDAQHLELPGSSDADASGAAEPTPGEGASTEESPKPKRRTRRKKKASQES